MSRTLVTIFIKLFNMSITAGWLILAVIALRFLLKKMPKWGRCMLWALVAVRLVLPFSFESALSLIPSAEPVSPGIIHVETPALNTGIPVIDGTVNPVLGTTYKPAPVTPVKQNPMQVLAKRAAYLWFAGMILMIAYAGISYLRLYRKVRTAMRYYDTVQYYDAIQRRGSAWICDEVATPFILGMVKPRVYLPSNLDEMQLQYVLAHENVHLKHCDHWWKPLGFVLLSVYWFHPLVWTAYVLLCKDIELACDESVIKHYGLEDKKAYSNALLACSVPRHLIAACPLAFGEVGVKERVKGVLNYKKPSFWIIFVTVLVCITGVVCFLTNPVKENPQTTEPGTEPATEPVTEAPTAETPTTEESANAEDGKMYSLSEFKVDLTGDGVEERIVLTAYGIDEESARRDIWNAGYGQVRVVDGSDDEKVLYTNDFSGSHAGNGNLAVVNYNGRNCLLVYDNTVYMGIGDYHYQVIGLTKQGTEEILAENSTSYAFESLPYAEGTPLLDSEEAYDGICKIEKELDEFLQAGDTWILVNASMQGKDECYIYEAGRKRIQTAFDVFRVGVSSDAASMEEFFNERKRAMALSEGKTEFNDTPDEYGFYDYLPQSYYEDPYMSARTYQGEDFLEKNYKLARTEKANISEAVGEETIEIYTGNPGDGYDGLVLVKDANGKILWSEDASSSRAGWNNVYLGNIDSMDYDYILIFYNENRDTYGAYGYCVYRLTEGGGIIAQDCSGMEWGSGYTYEDAKFKEWADNLNYYLANSKLLLSSQDGPIRTEPVCEADKYTYETLKPYETYEAY